MASEAGSSSPENQQGSAVVAADPTAGDGDLAAAAHRANAVSLVVGRANVDGRLRPRHERIRTALRGDRARQGDGVHVVGAGTAALKTAPSRVAGGCLRAARSSST